MKRVLAMAVCLIMILSLMGCGAKDKQECANVLDEFQYACNEKDVEAILRCIEPETSSNIRLALAFVGSFADMEEEELLEEIENYLIGSTEDVDAKELFSTLEMEVTEFKADGDYAAAYVNMSFEVMEVEMERQGVFYLTKIDDIWYIENLVIGSDAMY